MMNKNDFITTLYRAVDSKDTEQLVGAMAGNGIFRFANLPAVTGKENISAFLNGFFQSIKSIRHTDMEQWHPDGVSFVTGNVTYTRHDDSSLTVPFSVLLKMNGDLISEWLIFVDTSELYK